MLNQSFVCPTFLICKSLLSNFYILHFTFAMNAVICIHHGDSWLGYFWHVITKKLTAL